MKSGSDTLPVNAWKRLALPAAFPLYARSLSRLVFVAILSAFVLASCGCGMAEYNARCQKTLERLKQYDEEDGLLGEPVQLRASPTQVYLRLPRVVRANPAQEEIVRGLSYFPAQGEPDKLPVLEAYAGIVPVEEVGTKSILLDRIISDLQTASGSIKPMEIIRLPEKTEDQFFKFKREWEDPRLMDHKEEVAYEKWLLQNDREPPRDCRGQPIAALPKDCFAVYRYETFLHRIPSPSDPNREVAFAVVVFRQLDLQATKKQWQEVLTADSSSKLNPGAQDPSPADTPSAGKPTSTPSESVSPTSSPASNQGAGDIFRFLPVVDERAIQRAKEASLASLRIGTAAEQRLAFWK